MKVRAEPRGEHEVQLHIEVQDTGVGISAEQASKLFNAFVQADESTTRRFGGTGLGLAITRSLVELMGGRIGVRSQVGHGSVFWCLLPLGVAEAAPQAEATLDAPALSAEEAAALLRQEHGGARVLLAEDNAINSLLAMELLSMAGVDTTPAKNGAEAVALVQQQPFDLVLMDMHMPEMDGLQATRLIRQMPDQRDLPIVAMTASVLQEEKDACMAAGMNGHLSKPVDTQALYMALLKWFKMRRADQALQGGAAAAAADTAAGPA